MGTARSWARQLVRVSGLAVALPTALLAVVAVLAAGGGLPHLGALGQLFSGPAVGAADAAAAPGGPTVRVEARRLDTALAVAGGTAFAPAGAGAVAHGGVPSPPRAPSAAQGVGPGGGPRPLSGGGAPRPGGGRPAPGHVGPSGSGGGSGTPSGPLGQAVSQATTVAAGVTSRVPGPVGVAATQAVQQAGAAVEGLVGGHGATLRLGAAGSGRP